MGRGLHHVTYFYNFGTRSIYLEWVNLVTSNLVCGLTARPTNQTRSFATAEKPRDAVRQLKYYGRFLTEVLTRRSANAEEPDEHTVS